MPRWTRRPEGSNWGDFGPEDELGRLNLLTPERVRAAAAEIREGQSFCLSLPLDLPGGQVVNPRRFAPRLRPTYEEGRAFMNFALSTQDPDWLDVVCDDAVLLALQYSTQWDSLAHVGQRFDADGDGEAEVVYYNGFRGGEHVADAAPDGEGRGAAEGRHGGARRLGIENMAEKAIQGRGVLVDLHRRMGRERVLVGHDLLQDVMREDGVSVEEGDILCLYTGYADMLIEMDGDPDAELLGRSCAALDGRDPVLLDWISGSGIAALVADNYAVEAMPGRPAEGPHTKLPLHEHCLFKLGLPLGELWHLSELATWLRDAGRHRFFLTAPPLRLPGAVGSPVTPVGTV